MDKIIIEGNNHLEGTVKISGAKNAVLPIMTAALMVDGKSIISKVPNLRDTRTMIKLLNIVGADCDLEGDLLTIDGSKANNPEAPYDLVKTMRASFYVLGPLLARFGYVKVSLPGGCAWGPRPVDYHLKGLEKLGAKITLESGYILAESDQLVGSNINLEYPSVGATGNILMAAVLAKGTTVIGNAAKEPEIVQLCEFLNQMGASIKGIGSTSITIEGVSALKPANIEVIPDRIEAGTFLIAAAITRSGISLFACEPNHLKAVIKKLELCGCKFEYSRHFLRIIPNQILNSVNMTTSPFPGFPTDLQAPFMALMTTANGTSIIKEKVFENRMHHVKELNRMGANITVRDNTAKIVGVKNLDGKVVAGFDLRATAALALAGLSANGKTIVRGLEYLERGYEDFSKKLEKIGAKILEN